MIEIFLIQLVFIEITRCTLVLDARITEQILVVLKYFNTGLKCENCYYQCNKCSKEYPYRASVLRHVSAKDCRRDKEKKQCDICAKEFMYPSQLARHRKMHVKNNN